MFAAIYHTFTKISNILQLYLVHSTYDGFLCTRASKEGKNVKPTVIPSKSYSVAVFIYGANECLSTVGGEGYHEGPQEKIFFCLYIPLCNNFTAMDPSNINHC